jgi:RNA polymerase sigma-70 factor, ECF subfamily
VSESTPPPDSAPTPAARRPLGSIGNETNVVTEHFYAELRQIAHRIFASERAAQTLQPTAVVNEACLRLMNGAASGSGLPNVPREQRLAMAGRVLKQVLIDYARSRNAQKRSGSAVSGSIVRLDLEQDILAEQATRIDFDSIHRAMERLRQLSERQAEIVTLRMFAGLTMDQIATVLGISKRSAEGDWTVARAWLRRELSLALGGAAT